MCVNICMQIKSSYLHYFSFFSLLLSVEIALSMISSSELFSFMGDTIFPSSTIDPFLAAFSSASWIDESRRFAEVACVRGVDANGDSGVKDSRDDAKSPKASSSVWPATIRRELTQSRHLLLGIMEIRSSHSQHPDP
jgi:hypothetical protein